MGRAPCCEKVGLKKGRWTAEEDEILAKYIQANGEGSWRSLPKNAGLLRCGKSCRLRWINYLRTDLKRGNISAEEENTIVKLHAAFGNRWSLIASHLPGRTDNEIKNYWNSHLSRKIYSFPKIETIQPGAGVMDTPKAASIPPKRKGGRTSRWAMKKNKSYTQRPKQSFTQQNSDVAIPPPPTPSLESEGLSNAVTDFTVLDADVADHPRMEELEAELNNNNNSNTIKCDKSVLEESTEDDDILGLCELEGINEGSGELGFSDILEKCGVWDLSEERESNDVVGGDACPNKTTSSESSVSVNGESTGEWYSCCSSMALLDFDQHWDWESVIEFNNVDVAESEEACNNNNNWEDQEKLLTWLWEDDDDWESESKKLGETDPQKQNDMLDWFLS